MRDGTMNSRIDQLGDGNGASTVHYNVLYSIIPFVPLLFSLNVSWQTK